MSKKVENLDKKIEQAVAELNQFANTIENTIGSDRPLTIKAMQDLREKQAQLIALWQWLQQVRVAMVQIDELAAAKKQESKLIVVPE